MKTFFKTIAITIPFLFSGCSEKISDVNTKQLEHCKKEILKNNKSLIFPTPVGGWKELADIDVYYDGGRRIEVIYYFKKGRFSEDARQYLDSMQYRYAVNAGCKYTDVTTTAKMYQK